MWRGDALEILSKIPPASVDACVTDPPYGLGLGNRKWDVFKPQVVAHQRRIKSHDGRRRGGASVEYDRSLEAARSYQTWTRQWAGEVLPRLKPGAFLVVCMSPRTAHRVVSGVEDAGFEIRDTVCWLHGQGMPKCPLRSGRSATLKPAYEPILLARAPLAESVPATVSEHGTGALEIDACRIGTAPDCLGRWPPNVALDEATAAELDKHAGERAAGGVPRRRLSRKRNVYGEDKRRQNLNPGQPASYGAPSRFFYVAKASPKERDNGGPNPHPTVKPRALMRWLVRLVTPPRGLVLDPFAGSGTTGIACVDEELGFIGIEREPEYAEIALARIAEASSQLKLFEYEEEYA